MGNYKFDFKLIDERALDAIETLLHQFAYGGKHQRDEYLLLNPTRPDRHLGSFSINTRSGKWSDFATGDEGQGMISFVAYIKGINRYKAAKLISEVLG